MAKKETLNESVILEFGYKTSGYSYYHEDLKDCILRKYCNGYAVIVLFNGAKYTLKVINTKKQLLAFHDFFKS